MVYRHTAQTSHWLAALLCALCLLCTPQSLRAEDKKIDLRLFGQNVIEGYNGCRLAFWQSNKDPQKDNYAYVFFAPFNDGEELPGWIKIGKKTYELSRQDKGTVSGRALEDLRLYRTSKNTYSLLIEALEQHEAGNDLVIDKARLVFWRLGYEPFSIIVKGTLACPSVQKDGGTGVHDPQAPSSFEGDAISLGRGQPFQSLDAVPRDILRRVSEEAPDCSPTETIGAGTRYPISADMSLWELPCNLYARTASSVFVVAMNDTPSYSTIVLLPALPHQPASTERYEIRMPTVEPEGAFVSSAFYDGDGTCGTYERYQLRSVEGEALEFFLTEFRTKPVCDGIDADARSFPLIYSSGD